MLDGYSREQWKGTDRETTVMYEIAGNAYVLGKTLSINLLQRTELAFK